MGKNKKKFIDRKNAVTFRLVHRSQHDPLITDETAPQHVLVETQSKSNVQIDKEKRKKEQQKYGIFYDDDYDYLQHLKDPVTKDVIWECVETPNQHKTKSKTQKNDKTDEIQLPSSVFATEYEEEEGMLNKAAPCPGPKPDWDPDVVAALDDDFDFDNPENELDDDFVLKAMGDVENENENEENNMEFDEDESDVDSNGPMFDDEDENGELMDRLGALIRKEKNFNDVETKSRFTEYSLTSSVIRRNEQLQLLDERFEKFYSQYDEPEIGALDMEDIEGNMGQKHPMVLDCYRLYKKKTDCDKYNKEWDRERLKKYIEGHSSESDEELIELEVEDDRRKKWDCESILSTYSNIYNHPKLIEEPKYNSKKGKIQIDPKTGIPMNVLKGGNNNDKLTLKTLAKLNLEHNGDDDDDDGEIKFKNGPKSLCGKSVISTLSVLSIRPKDETPEEKKERKRLLKEYRTERRIERKANAEAFKEEKKRQQKIKINNQNNVQGNRMV